MNESIEPADEFSRFVEDFGSVLLPHFDGSRTECPICCGTVDQLAVTLDLAG